MSKRRKRRSNVDGDDATVRDRPSRWRPPLVCLVIALSVAAAFGVSMSAPFEFDDIPSIQNNVTIRGLWPPSVVLETPGLGTAVSGRPIANYSLALDYAINRLLGVAQSPNSENHLQTVVYHVTSLLIHLVAAMLLFGLVRRILQSGVGEEELRTSADGIAAVVALLWVVHPLQTEPVDYLSQRTETLAGVFYLGTLYAAIRALSGRAGDALARDGRVKARWTAVAVVLSLLGMGTKETMITAPFMVVLIDRAFFFPDVKAMWKRRRGLYLSLLVTCAWPLYSWFRGARSATAGFGLRVSAWSYLHSQGWAISHYLQNVFVPVGLTYDYGFNPIAGWRATSGMVFLALLAVAGIVFWRNPKRRWLGFLIAAFFILLAPSSSIIPIQTEVAADRRMYLPLAAVVAAFVVTAALLLRRRPMTARPEIAARRRIVVVALLAIGEVSAAARRSAMYNAPEALWRDAVEKVPMNPRALNGLSIAELRTRPRELREPDSLLDVALRLDSAYVPALLSKAAIAVGDDHLGDAEGLYSRVLRLSPDDSTANDKLGQVFLADGHAAQAMPYLRRVADWRPNLHTWTVLGVAYLVQGELDSSTVVLRRALAYGPNNVETLVDLGGSLIEQARGADAIPYLSEALREQPGAGATAAMLSLAYAQAGNAPTSLELARRAIELDPRDPAVYQFAGRTASTAGKSDLALSYFLKALAIAPDDPQTLFRLGETYAQLGLTQQAEHDLTRALAIAPNYERAQKALKQLHARRE